MYEKQKYFDRKIDWLRSGKHEWNIVYERFSIKKNPFVIKLTLKQRNTFTLKKIKHD